MPFMSPIGITKGYFQNTPYLTELSCFGDFLGKRVFCDANIISSMHLNNLHFWTFWTFWDEVKLNFFLLWLKICQFLDLKADFKVRLGHKLTLLDSFLRVNGAILN